MLTEVLVLNLVESIMVGQEGTLVLNSEEVMAKELNHKLVMKLVLGMAELSTKV